jgi:hypothetical protein
MFECECVVGRRFPMGARRGGVSGRNGRIPYEGVYVARFGGVMDEPAGVGVSKGGRVPLNPAPGVKPFHRGQHPCVELEATGHRKGVNDGSSSELMAEDHVSGLHGKQSALFRCGYRGVVADQGVEELSDDGRRHNREQLDDVLVSR